MSFADTGVKVTHDVHGIFCDLFFSLSASVGFFQLFLQLVELTGKERLYAI